MIDVNNLLNQNTKSPESSLHLQLKELYAQSGDKIESRIGRFLIDIVREDILIEIQTKNFSAIKEKLNKLIKDHKVLLVYPIIKDKWIHKFDLHNNQIMRKSLSPKHCNYFNIFEELIRIPSLISNPNLMIEALIIQADEIWVNDNKGSWRRNGWSIKDRALVQVLDQKLFSTPKNFLSLLPDNIETPFTNNDLSSSLNISLKLARMMTYCLRKMNLMKIANKRNRSYLFDFI